VLRGWGEALFMIGGLTAHFLLNSGMTQRKKALIYWKMKHGVAL
jgi:hypothetical protein